MSGTSAIPAREEQLGVCYEGPRFLETLFYDFWLLGQCLRHVDTVFPSLCLAFKEYDEDAVYLCVSFAFI